MDSPTPIADSPLTRADLWYQRRPLPAAPHKKKADPFDVRISLLITHPDEESVQVMEQRFGIRYVGPTREDAMTGFWVTFYGHAEILAAQRNLTPREREQLDYIQAVKDWEYRLQLAKDQHEIERKKRREGVDIPLEQVAS